MIDRQAMADELQQARLARIEAEDASCDLEELIWQIQHPLPSALRVAYTFEGFGRPLADWAN